MQYFWLAVIAVSIVPSAVACVLLNPLVFLLLGPDAWREQLARAYPYRWWIVASIFALAVATTIYGTRYASGLGESSPERRGSWAFRRGERRGVL